MKNFLNQSATSYAFAWAFLFAPFCMAEDWTTTDGRTLHDVKEISRNNIELHITCQEGVAWVLLKDLPLNIQLKYRYDAAKEAAMDAYLIRVGVAIPGAPPDPAPVQKYAAQLKDLLANRAVLNNLPPEQLIWLQRNRIDVGPFLPYKFALSPADADELPSNEIKLMGFMLMAIEARLNPAIDTHALISWQDQSVEAVAVREQMQIKRDIWDFVAGASWYLRSLYHHQIDGVSIEPEVRPILTQAGVDPVSIDLLVGKTKASDH